MSLPVQMSDLPVASVAVDGDLMLLRKGLTDYQINVTAIRNIDLTALSAIPSPSATDLMFIQRGSNRYSILFSQVGFQASVKLWFYNALVPIGWEPVANTGDRLLAVSDGTNNYDGMSPGTGAGDWQQTDHTLTINEMPSHTHNIVSSASNGDNSNPAKPVRAGANNSPNVTGALAQPNGGSEGHNHGNTWRPLANVGIIGNKIS